MRKKNETKGNKKEGEKCACKFWKMKNSKKYQFLRLKLLALDLSRYECIKSRFSIRYIRI